MASEKSWQYSVVMIEPTFLIHAQAPTKAQAWKVVHYFWWWCPSVRTYVPTYKTKQTDQRVKPLFKLVLWLVLRRGSLYDSSLVYYIIDITVYFYRINTCKNDMITIFTNAVRLSEWIVYKSCLECLCVQWLFQESHCLGDLSDVKNLSKF